MANFYAQYPSSSGGSNPSIGTNGAPAPTSSTEVGGINPSGNLQPLQTDASGNLKVDITSASGAPIHVIVDSSALPAGAATSANQASQITQETATAASTASIDTKSTTIATNTGNTATSTASIDTKSTTIATNTGTTATNTGNTATSVASIDTKTPTVGQKTMAASSPIVIASDQSALPVTIASVPLPSGAATAANQATEIASLASIDAGIPAALGQTTMAASMPVTIASNQSAIPTTDNTLDTYITGAGPATAVINTNILLAVTGTGSLDLQGSRSIAFQVVTAASTTAVAVNFEASNDNVTFVAVGMYDKTTPTAAPVTTFTTAASTNRYFEGPTEFRYFRVRLNVAIVAGSIQAFTILRSTSYVMTNNSLASGVQAIGSVTVASGTITAVTAITNALPAGTNTIGSVLQAGFALSNTPVTLAYTAGAPVTTAAYTQLIASTTSATKWIDIFDSSGQGMILATGAAASEVNIAYIPPGGDSFSYAVPASTRISIKALTANATSGYILLNMRG